MSDRPKPAIRKAVLADIPAIIALLADDDLGQHRETVTDPVDPAYLAAFDRISADPNQVLAVMVCADGVILGTLQISFLHYLTHRGATRAQIEGVRIASGARGMGAGEELMRWAIVQARDNGCRVVQLTTDKSRPAAHAFYSKLGFAPTHLGFKLTL